MIIALKDHDWLAKQKHAGRCVANILKSCGEAIKTTQPNLSLKDLEDIAVQLLKAYDCLPTFLNYNGFPAVACISVNKELVHGVASDYILQSGDIVSIDVGATYKGSIADAARTWIYGDPKNPLHVMMLDTCKEALVAGQNAVKIGSKTGAIGYTISRLVSKSPFGLITDYGGHGIGPELHEDPFVANKSLPTDGVHIVNGLSIAIEPMICIGQPITKVASESFTVCTPDVGCHFENSVTVMDDQVHIITEISNEN